METAANAPTQRPVISRGEVIANAESLLGVAKETVGRILAMPGPSADRINGIRKYQQAIIALDSTLTRLRTVDTRAQDAALERILHERSRLSTELTTLNALRRQMRDHGDDVLAETAQAVELKRRLTSAESEIQEARRAITTTIQATMDEPADSEALSFITELNNLVSSLGKHEIEQQRGLAVNAAVGFDFNNQTEGFKKALDYHRSQSRTMLIIMGMIIIGGAGAIMALFGDLETECIGRFTGVVESATLIEKLVLAGVGRIAVLALIGWSLTYVGTLHRSHAAQAVLYQDRVAALGLIANLTRSTTELEQKHALLKSITRGYIGFEQNAFHDGTTTRHGKSKSVLNQVKELVDILRPLLELAPKAKPKKKG